MFDQQSYCPYTGLRSFTEEEAIYFKGRDLHIEEATKQLEERKFLMLTGSSGDGKSSLVYAGIVPYARAGFLKSHFSSWIVADFKPERSPFENLCRVLAIKLQISEASVKAELSHGYSSLIELYKNSRFYFDKNSEEYLNTGEKEQELLRRKSSNLLILADQFEEFFTNPENYTNGVTSQESNLVINLLLETARIAKEENLPIFVVCTMRSDYIGQCAAFRGLPEYIGYSQFFVPRLNRKQLREVIEEPAILSGNQISNRLIERLIHDIVEGVDQLPILQHALNQIWRSAGEGKEEMDLIHYAMVGGMSGAELPENDKAKFDSWFDSLPVKIRNCYEEPNLQNVLNTHANKLYATAVDYYNENTPEKISGDEAKQVIHNVFICLTKIDHSRAVRNRMTLEEISNITNLPGLTTDKIRTLTAIFREPHNTLIQPYIDESGNDPLHKDDILDISHESLIRNWTLLKTWAKEEYSNINTFSDLRQQVERWVTNQRSADYLLPIGPLSHFEAWIKSNEPNKYWVSRYNEEIEIKEDRLKASEELLTDTRQYINASIQKHLITRTVMRLGARKIMAGLLLLSLILFSSFYIYGEYSKSVHVVLNKVISDGKSLLYDDNTDLIDKIFFIEEVVRSNPDNFELIFADLKEHLSVDLNLGIAQSLINRNQHIPHYLIDKAIHHADSLIRKMYPSENSIEDENQFLKHCVDYLFTLELKNYHQPAFADAYPTEKSARVLASYIHSNLENNESFNPSGIRLNNAIEFILNHKAWSSNEIAQVLTFISPLEPDYKHALKGHFNKDNSIPVGLIESSFSHNGLYQELGYLYASLGNDKKVLQCIDTLLEYSNGYFGGDYNLLQDNATNIAYYFLENGHDTSFDDFIMGYSKKTGISVLDFLDKMVSRSFLSALTSDKNITFNSLFTHNINLEMCTRKLRDKIFAYYEKEIQKIPNSDSRNFRMALYYKHKALIEAQYSTLSTGSFDEEKLAPIYQKAMDHYNKVTQDYLEENTNRMYWSARNIQDRRKVQFLFPGYLEYQTIWIPRFYAFHYLNSSFLNFLVNQGYLNEMYRESRDFDIISEWSSYLMPSQGLAFRASFDAFINFDNMYQFIMAIKENPAYQLKDITSLKVITARKLFEVNQNEQALEVAKEIDYDYLPTSIPDISNGFTNQKFTQLGKLAYQLQSNNETTLFENIIDAFDRPVIKGAILGYVAQHIGYEKKFDECRKLIEQAKEQENKKISEAASSTAQIISALMTLPDLEGYDEARRIWKNFPAKRPIDNLIAYNLSQNGDAWKAYGDIEALLPADTKMFRLKRITAGIRKFLDESESSDWEMYDKTNNLYWNPLFYVNN